MCMCMGTKTISIMDDVYDILKKTKNEEESFSDVIRRIAKKGDVMKFAGAWKDTPETEIKKMKGDILKLRDNSSKELLRLYKKK